MHIHLLLFLLRLESWELLKGFGGSVGKHQLVQLRLRTNRKSMALVLVSSAADTSSINLTLIHTQGPQHWRHSLTAGRLLQHWAGLSSHGPTQSTTEIVSVVSSHIAYHWMFFCLISLWCSLDIKLPALKKTPGTIVTSIIPFSVRMLTYETGYEH